MEQFRIVNGECLRVMRYMRSCSVDAIVTDPPYGLSFMGKGWDHGVPSFEVWAECLRILKPGGYLLAFAGTRTQHRMACNIEDAGFEIRDMIAWVYGSGFPKSLDISKAIDKAAGAEREAVGIKKLWGHNAGSGAGSFSKNKYEGTTGQSVEIAITAPATDEAKQWDGWGTALKPALESITVARKPLDIYFEYRRQLLILIKNIASICQLQFPVNHAGYLSLSNLKKLVEEESIAQWSVEPKINILDVLCDLMATLQSGLEQNSSLSIVLSWHSILVDLFKQPSTFTIETISSLTTELKTLNLSVLGSILQNITNVKEISQNEFYAYAARAGKVLSVLKLKLEIIQEHSVPGVAMSLDVDSSQEGRVAPNLDPIIMARKPLIGTVAQNVLQYGTGGINIDGCRVPFADESDFESATWGRGTNILGGNYVGATHSSGKENIPANREGRFPANFIHDGSTEVIGLFPDTTSGKLQQLVNGGGYNVYNPQTSRYVETIGDSGSAARFFYCAKASKAERDAGLDDFEKRPGGYASNTSGQHITRRDEGYEMPKRANNHPTVKPIDLMRYLCRLVTPPGGLVVDPFCGSGTTICGAMLEGFRAVGIEKDVDEGYVKMAVARARHWAAVAEQEKREKKMAAAQQTLF